MYMLQKYSLSHCFPLLSFHKTKRTGAGTSLVSLFVRNLLKIICQLEITDSRLHTAHRSVSRVCFTDAFAPQHSKQVCSAFGFQSIQSGFRNDYLFNYLY